MRFYPTDRFGSFPDFVFATDAGGLRFAGNAKGSGNLSSLG